MVYKPGQSDYPPKEGDEELEQWVEAALEQVLGKQLALVVEKLTQVATKEKNPAGKGGTE